MTDKAQGGNVAKALEPFVCGGAAATFASIFIHPIDLAKVRTKIESMRMHELGCDSAGGVRSHF